MSLSSSILGNDPGSSNGGLYLLKIWLSTGTYTCYLLRIVDTVETMLILYVCSRLVAHRTPPRFKACCHFHPSSNHVHNREWGWGLITSVCLSSLACLHELVGWGGATSIGLHLGSFDAMLFVVHLHSTLQPHLMWHSLKCAMHGTGSEGVQEGHWDLLFSQSFAVSPAPWVHVRREVVDVFRPSKMLI